MASTFNINNTKPAAGLGGTLVRLRGGLDPVWQGHLETSRGRCVRGKYPTVYTLKTWEPVGEGRYRHGSTIDRVEVVRPASGQGWCVRLFGEDQDEQYASKGEAQVAAERLLEVCWG